MTTLHSVILGRLKASYPEHVELLRLCGELIPEFGSLQVTRGLIVLEGMGMVECFESPNAVNYMLTAEGLKAMGRSAA